MFTELLSFNSLFNLSHRKDIHLVHQAGQWAPTRIGGLEKSASTWRGFLVVDIKT
jgi:hypothetical protein